MPTTVRARRGTYTAMTSGNEGNVAIEQATVDLNVMKQPIARRRLRKANPVVRTLAIRTFRDSVEVTLNNQWMLRTRVGSTSNGGYDNGCYR